MNIENIMTKKIITGSITNTIKEISEIMLKYDIGFLPIVDQKKVIGIITDRDIVVNALSNNANSNDLIEKYITKNIVTIDLNKSIEDVINLMGDKKIKRIIITDKNKLVGIISMSDIIKLNNYNNLIIENLKKLLEINRNDDLYKTEIDEFYL